MIACVTVMEIDNIRGSMRKRSTSMFIYDALGWTEEKK